MTRLTRMSPFEALSANIEVMCSELKKALPNRVKCAPYELEALAVLRSLLLSTTLLVAMFSSRAHAALDEVASGSEFLIFQGRIDQFGDRLLSSADVADVEHLLQVGNMLYRLDLQRAIQLHEKALKISPDRKDVLLELAYDYTAAGRCQDAVKAWDALQVPKLVVGATAAIASYCYVEVGEYDKAIASWALSDYLGRHVGVEKEIYNVFGRPDPAITHAAGFRNYADHGWVGAGEWVRNAIFWQSDWWNQSTDTKALESIRAELDVHGDKEALRELACVITMEDMPPEQALQTAKACGFVDADHAIPRNSGIAYVVAVRIGNANFEMLEEQWGNEIVRRAKQGDVNALKLAAALFAHSGNAESLAKIDELGWKKFKLAPFALSRLYGLGIGESNAMTAALRDQLNSAVEAFPLDAPLQMMAVRQLQPSGIAYRDAVAHLILAEFHSLSHSSELSAQPNARGLNGFFAHLGAAQSALVEHKVRAREQPVGD